MHSPAPETPHAERLRRSIATATSCSFAALPCIALGFTAPAFALAGLGGIGAVLAWRQLEAVAESESLRGRLTQERDRYFARSEAQALRAEASELRLRRMGERVRELYFEYDNESGRFVHLSPVFEKMFGFEPGSAYDQTEQVFACFDDSRRELFEEALRDGTDGERLRLEFNTPGGLLRRITTQVDVDERDSRLSRGTITLIRVGQQLAGGPRGLVGSDSLSEEAPASEAA